MKPFIIEIKVRGYHLDFFRHVNNARYLEFLEEARWAAIDGKIDIEEWDRRGIALVVVNININYHRPAVLGDTLEVRTWGAPDLGEKSGVIRQEIVLKGTDTMIADAESTFVVIDKKTNKSVPITGEIRALIEAMMS